MSVETLIAPMLAAPIFANLRPGQLKTLALSSDRVLFPSGSVLIETGQHGDTSFLIVAGHIQFQPDGPGAQVSLSGPGTVVGELAMLTEVVHRSTVQAYDDVRALSFGRALMHELFSQDPDLAEHFIGILSDRLKQFATELKAAQAALQTAA